MTRIRYESQNQDHILQSAKYFPLTDGRRVRIFLDTVTLTFSIQDEQGGSQAAGSAVSIPKLKLYAKKALESLGVAFDKESRS